MYILQRFKKIIIQKKLKDIINGVTIYDNKEPEEILTLEGFPHFGQMN